MPFLIKPKEGYSNQVGIFVSQMEHTRNDTIDLVKKLSIIDLDHNFDSKSNSIGTLLFHILTMEFRFQLTHFFKRKITSSEFDKYKYGFSENLKYRMIKGNSVDFYINELKLIRKSTLVELKKLDDFWLYEKFNYLNKYEMNNFFLIKHLSDDEINHQGQIKLILKRI